LRRELPKLSLEQPHHEFLSSGPEKEAVVAGGAFAAAGFPRVRRERSVEAFGTLAGCI
jgi:hypothetical protein